MSDTINQNCGPYRVTNRYAVVRTQREPMGQHKTNGPRMGLDPWIFGHQTAMRGLVPAVGLERKILGLTYGNTRPQLPTEEPEVQVVTTPKRGSGPSRGKGRRKRKSAKMLAKAALVAEYAAQQQRRDAQRAKIARDREMSSLVNVGREIVAGNVASLISNPAFEVTS